MNTQINKNIGENKLLILEIIRFISSLAVIIWHYNLFFFIEKNPTNILNENLPFYSILKLFYNFGLEGVIVFWGISGFIFFWKYDDLISQKEISAKKSYVKLYSYLLLILVAFLILPLLSKNFGLSGLAFGSLIAMGAWAIMETYLSQRIHPIEWRFAITILILLITVIFGFLHHITLDSYLFKGVSFIPLLGILSIMFLTWFKVFNVAERSSLTNSLFQKIRH